MALIDIELITTRSEAQRTELLRHRNHITRELAAGRRLPIEDEKE